MLSATLLTTAPNSAQYYTVPDTPFALISRAVHSSTRPTQSTYAMRRRTRTASLELYLVAVVVVAGAVCNCASAKFSGSYRSKSKGLPICETRAQVDLTGSNSTTNVYSIATGSCNMTQLDFPVNSSLIWNGTRTCAEPDTNNTVTITYVMFSCHEDRRMEVKANATRVHGRCYLEFGSATNSSACVYEDTESFGTLDWLIPTAILTSIVAIVARCCCLHHRVKRAAKPSEVYQPFESAAAL